MEATMDALVTEADISTALGGGGSSGDPAPGSASPAPAATPAATPAAAASPTPAPAATPAATAAPATPAEAEFEIAPGRKVKASDLTNWEKSHTAYEGMKPLRDLDQFLSRPEQKELADAITGLLGSKNPGHVKQVLAMLSGQAPTNGAANGQPPADPFAEIEKNLDLTDPSVKALYDLTKSLHGKIGEFDQFRTSAKTEQEKAGQAQQVKDAETRLQTSMDGAWKTHQFDALLERVDEKYRGETGNLLRKMILTVAGLPGPNQMPIEQVAKTLHGQMSGLIEGVINAYVAGKKQAPPAGGGRGPVQTPPATPQLGSDDMTASIVEGLKASQATRE